MHTFRTGQLLASPALFSVLAEQFAIDMSIPDTERDGPYGGHAGCGTVLPFRFHGLLELPVTMPQEVFLRQVYGLSADESLRIWRDKLAYIKQVGGVASLNVHPVWLERDAELARVLRTLFAELARDDELLITTPSHLAAHVERRTSHLIDPALSEDQANVRSVFVRASRSALARGTRPTASSPAMSRIGARASQ